MNDVQQVLQVGGNGKAEQTVIDPAQIIEQQVEVIEIEAEAVEEVTDEVVAEAAEGEPKGEKKEAKAKEPQRLPPLYPDDVTRLLHQKAAELNGDKLGAAKAVFEQELRRRIKTPYVRKLLAPVFPFVLFAFKESGKKGEEARTAAIAWMEEIQRPLKFTPKKAGSLLARNLSCGQMIWLIRVIAEDTRLTKAELEALVSHLAEQALTTGLNPVVMANWVLAGIRQLNRTEGTAVSQARIEALQRGLKNGLIRLAAKDQPDEELAMAQAEKWYEEASLPPKYTPAKVAELVKRALDNGKVPMIEAFNILVRVANDPRGYSEPEIDALKSAMRPELICAGTTLGRPFRESEREVDTLLNREFVSREEYQARQAERDARRNAREPKRVGTHAEGRSKPAETEAEVRPEPRTPEEADALEAVERVEAEEAQRLAEIEAEARIAEAKAERIRRQAEAEARRNRPGYGEQRCSEPKAKKGKDGDNKGRGKDRARRAMRDAA